MTTPYILARRKVQQEAGKGGSSFPLLTDPGPKLAWQKQDESAQEQVDKRNALSANMTPINDTLDTGLNQATVRNQIIDNIGQQENQRVAQEVAAKAQAEAEAARQAALASAQSMPAAGVGNTYQATGSQGQYSGADAQLADIARKGGFQEKDIPMAIAIMKAESGGNARALNTSNRNGSTDTGIFQINSIHSGWTKQFDLYDPVQNAKAAFKIFSDAGGTWKPWSTYTNNAYSKFLKQPSAYAPAPNAIAPYAVSTKNGMRAVAVQTAMRAIGVPYVWGGNSLTKGVDCSGLVQQVYKSLGISMPRTADEQAKRNTYGTRTTIDKLKPGDLVAWSGNRAGMGADFVGHIAVYAGNGEIIEAYTAGAPVRRRSLRAGEKAFGISLSLPGD